MPSAINATGHDPRIHVVGHPDYREWLACQCGWEFPLDEHSAGDYVWRRIAAAHVSSVGPAANS
jgi:hypothetical protein